MLNSVRVILFSINTESIAMCIKLYSKMVVEVLAYNFDDVSENFYSSCIYCHSTHRLCISRSIPLPVMCGVLEL